MKSFKHYLTKGTTMKYAKTLKENLQLVKESWMPDSETISWLKDYLRDVKRGEGYVDIDKVVYDADIELNKDFSKNKKDLADYIKRIGGASILKEDQQNESIKAITESIIDGRKIRFDSFGGGLEVNLTRDGFSLYGFGSGTVDYKKPGFTYEDMDEKTYRNLISDIAHFANRFDKDVKDVMAKYGFKK